MCMGEPGHLHPRDVRCQPHVDLRQRGNAQVNKGSPVTRSSPEIFLSGVSGGDTPTRGSDQSGA